MSSKSARKAEAKAGSHANVKAKARPTTIDEYLAPLPADQRAALERLRSIIHATVRFTPVDPLPAALVRKLVKARMKTIA